MMNNEPETSQASSSQESQLLELLVIAITALSGAAALGEIFLGLTQDCLTEVLLALGITNVVVAAGAFYTYQGIQKPQGGVQELQAGQVLELLVVAITALSGVAALAGILLGLTQECLTEVLLALGITNAVIAAGAFYTYQAIQKPQGGVQE